MQTTTQYATKIFKSGNSMAIRIPKGIDLTNYEEAFIVQTNNSIIISPKPIKHSRWDQLFKKLSAIKSDNIAIEKLPSKARIKYFD